MGNWNTNEIGFNTTVGKFGFGSLPANPNPDPSFDEDPTYNGETLPTVNPIAASTNQTDRRYKVRPTLEISGDKEKQFSRRLTRGIAIVEGISYVGTAIMDHLASEDLDLALNHAGFAAMAQHDVFTALQEGMIPNKHKNQQSLSDLANIVLQGESYLNKTGAVKDRSLIDLGNKIFKEVSMRRYKYKYVEPVTLKDGKKLAPLVANPLYDSKYGQEESSNNTKSDQNEN